MGGLPNCEKASAVPVDKKMMNNLYLNYNPLYLLYKWGKIFEYLIKNICIYIKWSKEENLKLTKLSWAFNFAFSNSHIYNDQQTKHFYVIK